jgi:Cu(I)/Ag(I) efflux system membrane protein CusA/SilA
MQPMAIPSVGGMSIQLMTLFIAPCIYCLVQEAKYRRREGRFEESPEARA